MTMCYGSFFLRRLPSEAVETEAQALDVLHQFARLGFCLRFREIVNGRVVELRFDSPTRTTSHHWLEGAEAESVLQLGKLGNCVPASWMLPLVGLGPVLVPKPRNQRSLSRNKDTEWTLETGQTIRFNASGATSALEVLRYTKSQAKRESDEEFAAHNDSRDSRKQLIEFYDELLQEIDRCRKAQVLYVLSEL